MHFGDPRRRRRRKSKKGAESLFEEIMTDNFPSLQKETHPDPRSRESSKHDKPRVSGLDTQQLKCQNLGTILREAGEK